MQQGKWVSHVFTWTCMMYVNDRNEHVCLGELFLMYRCKHMLFGAFYACVSAMIVCYLCLCLGCDMMLDEC